MNREIKFRAYHHLTKKIINPEEVSSKALGKNPIEWHNERKWTLMQYTGLKDKNGKEIYEGDILTYNGITSNGNKIIREVNYNSENARFQSGMYPLTQSIELSEIIGNIYENPEFTQSSE